MTPFYSCLIWILVAVWFSVIIAFVTTLVIRRELNRFDSKTRESALKPKAWFYVFKCVSCEHVLYSPDSLYKSPCPMCGKKIYYARRFAYEIPPLKMEVKDNVNKQN